MLPKFGERRFAYDNASIELGFEDGRLVIYMDDGKSWMPSAYLTKRQVVGLMIALWQMLRRAEWKNGK